MSVTATGTAGVKNTPQSSATHDLSFAMPADADFCRVSISVTNISFQVSTVTWDVSGGAQLMSRPSGLSTFLENGDGHRGDEFTLVAPVTGTKTLRVVFTGSVDGPVITIQAYKGVNQVTPVSGLQSFVTPGPGDTASPTDLTAVTSVSGDLVVESLMMRFAELANFTRDASQTEEASATEDTLGGGALKSSNKTGASSVTMQYTFAGTKHYCMVGYNVKAAAGADPRTDGKIIIRGTS